MALDVVLFLQNLRETKQNKQERRVNKNKLRRQRKRKTNKSRNLNALLETKNKQTKVIIIGETETKYSNKKLTRYKKGVRRKKRGTLETKWLFYFIFGKSILNTKKN